MNTKNVLEKALSPLAGIVEVVTFEEFQKAPSFESDDDSDEECDLCSNFALKDGDGLCEECTIKVNKEAAEEEREHIWEIDQQMGRE